ncbi:amidohydrolase [Siminovitchia terrae]|uniref:M20 family metallopeptidase n=1 Tax=Siminovitchia terrae TaxID=1914933 RepID=UPI001B1B6C7C|nr:M20 family metallopeptidase [Siminovitchia terrae]GIN93426.1 amidohydrolase [Siminovitchia terrae]
MKDRLTMELDKIKQQLWKISDQMYTNPELGDEEFESMGLLTQILTEHGFHIQTNIVNRSTAFKAEFHSEKSGPTIAYLAEYDALPEIGHGCGHNLIGTMSVGAGIILSKIVKETGGSVVVLGTPAEETNGAKVPMSKEGIFNDVDVAMILHPYNESVESGTALAVDALQFKYKGRSSHAAAAPEHGINALDSVIQLFNGINALREHLPSDVRVHGIIAEGGQAANIVPDLAIAQFYVRAKERSTLDETVGKIINIANGAALMTGSELEISNYQISYDNMVTNNHLSRAFTENLKEVTGEPVKPAEHSNGSLDMGNVSRVVPAIHPFIGLNDKKLVLHTQEFSDRTISKDGQQALVNGALALACTGYDVLTDHELLENIKNEFKELVK